MSKKKKLATYPAGGPFGDVQTEDGVSLGDGTATVNVEYDDAVFTDQQVDNGIAAFIDAVT